MNHIRGRVFRPQPAPFLSVQVLSRFSGTGRSNYATTQQLH
jgi:hypothetical protein